MARASAARPAASWRAASAKASWTVSCISAGARRPCRSPAPRSASDGLPQQRADVVREDLRPLAVALVHAQPPLGIEDVRAGGMVDAVRAGRRTRLLLIQNLEFLRGLRGRRRVAVEPEKAGIESRHVVRKEIARVALR